MENGMKRTSEEEWQSFFIDFRRGKAPGYRLSLIPRKVARKCGEGDPCGRNVWRKQGHTYLRCILHMVRGYIVTSNSHNPLNGTSHSPGAQAPEQSIQRELCSC